MNKDFNEDWIEQVDTLSREECETIEDELLACKFPWWTKSPAWIGCVTIVYQNGSMSRHGLAAFHPNVWMRPALRLSDDCSFRKLDTFEYKDLQWTMVDVGIALCQEPIKEIQYREGTITNKWELPDGSELPFEKVNVYEESFLKRALKEWADSLGIPQSGSAYNTNEKIEKALAFAVTKHSGQTRKNGEPYIWHLIRVTEMLKAEGFGSHYQVPALLHDVLEDTDTSEEEIAKLFGEETLRIVKLLTKHKGDDLQLYIDRILADPIAREVKNADRLNNLYECVYTGKTGEPYSKADMEFMERYIKQTQKYFRGRFSKALDESINSAEKIIGSRTVPNRFQWYTCSTRTYPEGNSPVEIKAKE